MDHYTWQTSFFPLSQATVEDYVKELNKGGFYVYRRDRKMRPIFIIPVKKLTKVGIE